MKKFNGAIVLLSVFIFSLNVNAAVLATSSIEQIEIQGGLLDMAAYSTKSELTIFQYDTELRIQYNHSFGVLNVSIENYETGTISIQEYINVIQGTIQIIDISGLEEGIYTITIVNSKDKCVSGTFEVN